MPDGNSIINAYCIHAGRERSDIGIYKLSVVISLKAKLQFITCSNATVI